MNRFISTAMCAMLALVLVCFIGGSALAGWPWTDDHTWGGENGNGGGTAGVGMYGPPSLIDDHTWGGENGNGGGTAGVGMYGPPSLIDDHTWGGEHGGGGVGG